MNCSKYELYPESFGKMLDVLSVLCRAEGWRRGKGGTKYLGRRGYKLSV